MATIAVEPAPTTALTWLSATDHKRIGLLYLTSAFAFMAFGGLLALVIRTELASPGLQVTDA
jgi:cytochrome c oxidase subunit 1